MKLTYAILPLALTLVFGSIPAQAQFAVTSLQFPGSSVTRGMAINDHGEIAGAYEVTTAQHALLIVKGQYIPLDPLGALGAGFSQAFGSNDRGQIVGTYVDDQGVQHGFLLDDSELTTIDFPGGTATIASGINGTGTIIGYFFDLGGALHGFVWRAGSIRRFDVPGAADTQPTGINSRGDIVGSWDTDINTQGHGFVRTAEGQFITIDDPSAAPQSTSALGINDHGQIVGTYTDALNNAHGFLATGGVFSDLDVPGADATTCWGINNAGSIVGNYATGSLRLGFLATPSRTETNLVSVPLNVLWRVVVNGTDRMTSVDPIERDEFPLEGQTFYVPSLGNVPQTQTLYRLLSFSGADHRDSTTAESGYTIEGPLGFPWTNRSASRGLEPLMEGFNAALDDFAILGPFEQIQGYSEDTLGVYGYGRFDNQAESLLSLSAGGVTIQSNRVAGGSLWHWFWNGQQFINNHDFGRQVQAAFFVHASNTLVRNPTEAGDQFSSPDLRSGVWHGSPLLQAYNVGSTQVTRAIPLDFDPGSFGGDQDHPVIWQTVVLGKDVALNFNNMGSVAKYTTHLKLPSFQAGTLEMPTPYLRSAFNRFWTYDASNDTLSEVTSVMPDACDPNNPNPAYIFAPDFGGVIVSDSTAAYAMGEYAVNISAGGPTSYLAMWKFFCVHDGTTEKSFDTTKLDAVRGPMPFTAGDNAYNAYLMTDSVQGVREKMRQLFLLGAR